MFLCSQCNVDCVFKSRPTKDEIYGAYCDLCRNAFCKKCVGLTTTEASAVAVADRLIVFFCPRCKDLTLEQRHTMDMLAKSLEKYKEDCNNKEFSIETLQNRYEEIENILKMENNSLREEIKNKTAHIARLNRRTQDFENDVFNLEGELKSEIEEKKVEISRLNGEVIRLVDSNSLLNEHIKDNKELVKTLEKKLSELNELKSKLMTTIETLEKENEMHFSDLKKAKLECFKLQTRVNSSTRRDLRNIGIQCGLGCATLSKNTATIGRSIHRRASNLHQSRILMLSDEHGRNLSGTLDYNLAKQSGIYKTEHILKPGATFRSVVQNVEVLSRDMSQKDFIIVMAGSNDFYHGKSPSIRDIQKLISDCANSNLIIFSTPYVNCYKTNLNIFEFNTKLYNLVTRVGYVSENGISFIDSNTSNGLPKNNKSNRKAIIEAILSLHVKKHSSLIFINTQSLVPDNLPASACVLSDGVTNCDHALDLPIIPCDLSIDSNEGLNHLESEQLVIRSVMDSLLTSVTDLSGETGRRLEACTREDFL